MLYWLIISIVIVEFVYDLTLDILSVKASRNPIPSSLAGLYDDATYNRQQAYYRMNKRMGFFSLCVSSLFSLAVFAFGGYGWVDGLVRSWTDLEILRTLYFFAVFGAVSFFLSLPFDIYDTFVIEERFGFNKVTPRLYIIDTLKSIALNGIIGGGILAVVVWIYGLMPDCFWIVGWGVLSVFMLFFQYFYSVILVPIFNKQTPLPQGDLRNAIEAFAQNVGFRLKDIYVIDGSKRSTHANAYFTGFGRQKRIVLYDTLIEDLTTEEIVGVLAHEIGHYKHHHIIKSLVVTLFTSLATFYLLGLVMGSRDIALAAGSSEPSFYVNLVVFSMLYTPISLVMGVIGNVSSRRNERQADRFAVDHGVGQDEASALKKMSAKSLANLTPHPVCVFTEYSHPPLYQRVEALTAKASSID